MSTDKTLRFLVDDQKIKDLSKTANELAREMVVSARQYSTSSKQVVQDIEEQIRLIEKRNKTDKEIEQTKIQSRFAAGQITPEQRREELGRTSMSSKTDDIQIRLLRDIIDTLKSTAKEELREDKINVEKRIRDSKTVDVLSPKGDPLEIFKETIQRGEIGTKGKDEAQERRDFIDFGRGAKKADRALSVVAGSSNEFSMLAAGIGALLGVGAGTLANRAVQEAAKYEKSVTRMGVMTDSGITGGKVWGGHSEGRRYGFNPAEVAERQTSYRTSGQRYYSDGEVGRMFGAERRLGVSQEQISEVAGASRYGNSDPTKTIMMFETYLRKTDQNISLLPEILRTYTSVASNLLGITTGADTQRAAGNLASLGHVTGAEGVGLQQWSQGVQGLGKTQNPMVRAALMRKFSEKFPNATPMEIRAMMERPMEFADVIGESLSDLTSGMSGDMKLGATHEFFGKQISLSEIVARRDTDFSQLGVGGYDTSMSKISEDPTGYIGAIERSQKGVEHYFQIYGEKVVSSIDEMFEKVKGLFGGGGMEENMKNDMEDVVARGTEKGMENYKRKNQQEP